MSRHDAELALVQLRRKVDDHFASARARTPEAFHCRDGCAQCCGVRFGVFAIEAARVARALDGLPAPVRARVRAQADDPGHTACALLVDDRCSVYEERPMICRSHGVPVQHEADDGATHVEVCPLNFVGHTPPPASVLVLERIDAPLALMSRMWDGACERIELAALARAR